MADDAQQAAISSPSIGDQQAVALLVRNALVTPSKWGSDWIWWLAAALFMVTISWAWSKLCDEMFSHFND